jgi:hypothetical protein
VSLRPLPQPNANGPLDPGETCQDASTDLIGQAFEVDVPAILRPDRGDMFLTDQVVGMFEQVAAQLLFFTFESSDLGADLC